MWFTKRIYLDYASAPPVLREASRAMRRAETMFGNPGAIHAEGVAAKKNLEESRSRIAYILGCKARQLVFTSGLTEANNLAIVGYAKYLERIQRGLSGTHWIVSSIEHDSVLESFAEIERIGGSVTHVDPDESGIVGPHAIARALRSETVFVSVGWANNETGVVQPLSKIARVLEVHAEEHGCTKPILHADAGQAPLYLPTLVNSLDADLLSLGANKLYGPHGIGALYISNDVPHAPIIVGGKQERGLRAGTESVPLAAGFAAALEIVAREREKESKRLGALRDELAREFVAQIPGLVINGDLRHTLPHMLNISYQLPAKSYQTAEYVALALDAAGIAVSTKSACREGEERRSHVVAAMFPKPHDAWRASNTLRMSLGRDTSEADIRYAVKELARILKSV